MPDETINTATADGEVQQNVNTGVEQEVKTENSAPGTGNTQQTPQSRTFTQADVDAIIEKRLAREKQRYESEMKSNPHLSYLEQKAQRLGITVEQLLDNDRKYEEQRKIDELVQKNIPPEYAQKLLEHDKIVNEYTQEKQTRQQREQQQQMYSEFLEEYPDVKPNEIPPEVWQAVKNGERLLNAYARYENKLLKERLAGERTQQQVQQANEKNAAASTGSAKTSGSAVQGYISKEVYDQNKGNQKWMDANYDNVVSSMKHWK